MIILYFSAIGLIMLVLGVWQIIKYFILESVYKKAAQESNNNK